MRRELVPGRSPPVELEKAAAPPPHPVLELQRAAGNRAVSALLQRFRQPGTGAETTVHQLGSKTLNELFKMLKEVRAKKLEAKPEELWDLQMALIVRARTRLRECPDEVKPANRFGRAAESLDALSLALIEDERRVSRTRMWRRSRVRWAPCWS